MDPLLGTGKSLLLKAIIDGLRRKYANNPEAVAVTASTGMAASNIGGRCQQIICLGGFVFTLIQVKLYTHGVLWPLL